MRYGCVDWLVVLHAALGKIKMHTNGAQYLFNNHQPIVLPDLSTLFETAAPSCAVLIQHLLHRLSRSALDASSLLLTAPHCVWPMLQPAHCFDHTEFWFTMARLSMARSPSTSSTLSCITVGNNQSSTTSVTSSTTPPTSISDATSISSKDIEKLSTSAAQERRVLRVRMSIGGLNEGTLAGNAKRTCRRNSVDEGYRMVSGGTLVADEGKKQRQLVQDSIQALDLDWKVDAMPGDRMRHSVKALGGTGRRRSTRLNMLETASSIVDKTKSILGKRGRDAFELGKDTLQALNRRESLRPRELNAEGPVEKKTRVSTALDSKRAISPPPKSNQKGPTAPRVKRWLSQGLYVGQDRGFDARLTETKNKLKKASMGPSRLPQRSVLPLPMFAGERTLELGRDFRLPFHVFSPLPPGQPKPEEWRKTQKSMHGFMMHLNLY